MNLLTYENPWDTKPPHEASPHSTSRDILLKYIDFLFKWIRTENRWIFDWNLDFERAGTEKQWIYMQGTLRFHSYFSFFHRFRPRNLCFHSYSNFFHHFRPRTMCFHSYSSFLGVSGKIRKSKFLKISISGISIFWFFLTHAGNPVFSQLFQFFSSFSAQNPVFSQLFQFFSSFSAQNHVFSQLFQFF